MHAPFAHPVEQTVVHEPQCAGSVFKLTSQPLPAQHPHPPIGLSRLSPFAPRSGNFFFNRTKKSFFMTLFWIPIIEVKTWNVERPGRTCYSQSAVIFLWMALRREKQTIKWKMLLWGFWTIHSSQLHIRVLLAFCQGSVKNVFSKIKGRFF